MSQTEEPDVAVDRTSIRRIAMAGGIGTMLEQFDFAVYGLAAALIFPHVFFPESDPLVGAIASFSGYAVGFLARPIGGVVFSHFGEKHGRKWVLVATLILMGTATFLIGCIPGYAVIGVAAPVLLFALRLLQGFGAGAEQSGGATLLTESSPIGQRGRISSFVMVGAAAGTAFGTLFFAAIQWAVPEDVFLDWAWRLVFWLSLLVTVAAFIIRRHLDESPVFTAMQKNTEVNKAQAAPLKVAATQGWRRILAVALMNWGPNTQSYTVQTFFVTFVTTYVLVPGTDEYFSKSTITDIQLVGAIVGMAAAFMWGSLSDKFGRKAIYLVIAVPGVVLPFAYFGMMSTGLTVMILLAVCLGYIFAAYGNAGVQTSYFPELFGTRYRYAGVTLGRELSALLGGGIAPLVCAWLLKTSGTWWPIAVYGSVLMIATVITSIVLPETVDRDLTMLEDAKPGEERTAHVHEVRVTD